LSGRRRRETLCLHVAAPTGFPPRWGGPSLARLGSVLAFGSALCTASRAARAGDPFGDIRVDIRQGDPGCIEPTRVLQQLRANWGPAAEPLGGLAVELRVEQAAQKVVLDYRAERAGAVSERRLAVDTCDEAGQAAALLIQLTLDPSASLQTAPVGSSDPMGDPPSPEAAEAANAPPAPPQGPAAPEVVQAASESDRAATRPRHAARGWVGGGGLALTSIAPAVGIGPALDVGAALGLLRLRVSGAYLFVGSVSLPDLGDARLDSSLWLAQGDVGLDFRGHRLSGGPYVGLGVYGLNAEIEEGPDAEFEGTVLTSVRAGGVGRWHFARDWGLGADLGIVVPLERPEFLLDGQTEPLHRPGAVGLAAQIGFFWGWGSQF